MVRLNLNIFRDMVCRCKVALASEDTRPMLKYITIKVSNKKITMWGTNGYQINVVEVDIDSEDEFTSSFNNLYIPSNDKEVEIEKNGSMLECTYKPSGLKICMPQPEGEPFNVPEYMESSTCKKDYAIAISRDRLEKALKKYGRTKAKTGEDVLILRVNTESQIKEIEIINKTDQIKQTSYVLPVRCTYINEYIDK